MVKSLRMLVALAVVLCMAHSAMGWAQHYTTVEVDHNNPPEIVFDPENPGSVWVDKQEEDMPQSVDSFVGLESQTSQSSHNKQQHHNRFHLRHGNESPQNEQPLPLDHKGNEGKGGDKKDGNLDPMKDGAGGADGKNNGGGGGGGGAGGAGGAGGGAGGDSGAANNGGGDKAPTPPPTPPPQSSVGSGPSSGGAVSSGDASTGVSEPKSAKKPSCQAHSQYLMCKEMLRYWRCGQFDVQDNVGQNQEAANLTAMCEALRPIMPDAEPKCLAMIGKINKFFIAQEEARNKKSGASPQVGPGQKDGSYGTVSQHHREGSEGGDDAAPGDPADEGDEPVAPSGAKAPEPWRIESGHLPPSMKDKCEYTFGDHKYTFPEVCPEGIWCIDIAPPPFKCDLGSHLKHCHCISGDAQGNFNPQQQYC